MFSENAAYELENFITVGGFIPEKSSSLSPSMIVNIWKFHNILFFHKNVKFWVFSYFAISYITDHCFRYTVRWIILNHWWPTVIFLQSSDSWLRDYNTVRSPCRKNKGSLDHKTRVYFLKCFLLFRLQRLFSKTNWTHIPFS